MTIYLEFKDAKSAKFWKINVTGTSHTVTYGKIGTDGQSKTKTFESAEKATKDAEKLVKAKTKKGYQAVGTEEEKGNASSENKKTPKVETTSSKSVLISQEEAMERFDLDQYDPLGSLDYDTVLVFEGDTVIESDINHDSVNALFFNNARETEEELIVINGNLTVKGALDLSEEYPCLLVLGDLHCEVLCSNDNCINVTGDAHIKYVYDGNYNHGSITIEGETKVPYLLNSDHDSRLNPSPKTILINYYGDYDDFFNYDYYSEDLPNILTKGIMEGDDFDAEKFIARVKTGKSPFKSGVKPSRILVENEIKKLAKKNKSGEGLKELDLKEKKLLKLPLAIFELESLEHLKLEGNKFTVLPKALGKLTNLKELNLRATNVEEIPASIAQLKNLEVLNLNYCHHLKRLPDAIGELTNLKKLTLWSFKGEIPESILKLTHLEELDINGMYNNHEKGLFDFPQWVCQLKGLKKLSISSNAFKSIPKEILNLSNLEVLNLNTALCCLEEPLPDLSQLKNLKELECGGRRLGNRPHPKQEILQNFFKISSLEILNIDAFSIEDDWMPNSTVEENRAALKDDPKKLAEFERRLRVNDSNQYYYEIRRQMTLEDFKGLDNLVHLRALDIRWNKLDALPKEVFSLKHLENLNIYGNNIAKEDMAALQKLNPDIRFSNS